MAPAEYRGPFKPIATKLPGVQFCELMPRHAEIIDKIAVIRSINVGSSGHDVGMYYCTTGKTRKGQPSAGSYVARIRGGHGLSVPPNVHLGFTHTANRVFVPNFKSGYLGSGHDPFYIHDDPAGKTFTVPNLQLVNGMTIDRLGDRRSLLSRFDTARRRCN